MSCAWTGRFPAPSPRPASSTGRRGRRAPAAPYRVDPLERRVLLAAVWTGNGDGVHWSDKANWLRGITPAEDNVVRFPATATTFTSVNTIGPLTLSSLTIEGTGFNISMVDGGGGLFPHLIKFTGAGLVTTQSGSDNTFNLPIDTTGTTTVINVASAATLKYHTLTQVLNGLLLGDGAVTKTGAGTLILSLSNDRYDGNLTADNGTVRVEHPLALGSTAGRTFATGTGTIELRGGAAGADEGLRLAGTGFNNRGALRVGTTMTWDGDIRLTGDASIFVDLGGTTFTPNGFVDVAGNVLTKRGNGTFELAQPYNLIGGATIADGVVALRSGGEIGPVTVSAGASLVLRNTVEVAHFGVLSLSGTGHDTLGGALVNASGFTNWRGRILADADATINSSAATGSLTLGPIDTNGHGLTVAGSNDIDITGDVTTTGAGVIFAGPGDVTVTGVITGDGSLTKNGPGTLEIGGQVTNSYRGLTTINGGVVRPRKAFAFGFSGLGGGDPLAAGTRVNAGGAIHFAANLQSQEHLTIAGAGGAGQEGALLATGGGTWPGNIVMSADAKIGALGGTLTLFGHLDTGGHELTVAPVNSSDAVVFGGDGVISGAGEISKTGAGTLVLGGTQANTYTGQTFVNAGVLEVGKPGALGGGAPAASNGTTVSTGGALRLAGELGTLTAERLVLNGTGPGTTGALLNASGANTWAGDVVLATTSTIGVSAGDALTITGVVSGAGALTKVGNGTLTLGGTAANTNAGALTVASGPLRLNKPAGVVATGAGGVTVATGAAGALAATLLLLADNQIPDGAAVTVNSTGLFDLAGRSETVGPLTLVGGDVTTGAGTLTLNGNVTAHSVTIAPPPNTVVNDPVISGRLALGNVAARVFDVGPATGLSASTLRIDATVSGTAGLTKIGIQSLVLAGTEDNTYTGVTQVNAGTLVLAKSNRGRAVGAGLVVGDNGVSGTILPSDVVRWDADNQVPDDAAVTVNASGTLNLAGHDETLGPVTMDGSLIQTGTGLLTLNGTLIARASDVGPVVTPARIDGRIDLGPANPVTGRNFQVNNGPGELDLVVGAVVSGAVQLNKLGTGALELAGANTMTGRTFVSGGALYVTGTTEDVGSQLSDVAGDGTVGALAIGTLAVLGPGTLADPTARLTATGSLSFGDDSRYEVDLRATGIGSFDQVQVGHLANVDLGDVGGSPQRVSLTVRLQSGFNPVAGAPFTIIDNTGAQPVAGRFSGLAEGATVTVPHPDGGTRSFVISYRGGDGNDVVLRLAGGSPGDRPPTIATLASNPNPVPAGATVTLTAIGVSDPDGTINRVSFFRESNNLPGLQVGAGGDTPAGEDLSNDGGYTAAVATAGLAPGEYTYYARATDNDSPTRMNSDPVSTTNTVTAPPNQPPTVGALADSPDPVTRGTPLVLTASGVSDPDGTVAFVAFFRESNGTAGLQTGAAGDTALGTDANGAEGFAVTVNTAGLAAGQYAYYARATDDDGASGNVASTTNTVQDPPPAPTVSAVFVSSTAWAAAFRDSLVAAGLGNQLYGFAVPGGAQQSVTLPWSNLNQITIRFSEDVSVQQADLAVVGVSVKEYAATDFRYDPRDRAATWTLAASIGTDRLTLDLDGDSAGAVVGAATGVRLDGEWADAADAFPSGDGAAGGDFRFRINVLRGDANRNGVVDPTDLLNVRRALGATPASSNYSPFADLDGNGRVNVIDFLLARSNQRRRLPVAATLSFSAG